MPMNNPFGRYSLPNVLGRMFHGGNSSPMPVQRQAISQPSNLSVPNLGHVSYGPPMQPMWGGQPMGLHEMATQPAMTGPIGGFVNGVFNGGQGNFGPLANMAAGSGMGGARGRNGGGWSGEAAQGMFQGMSDASRFNSSAASFGDYGQRNT